MTIYADTSFLVSWLYAGERHNAKARSWFVRIFRALYRQRVAYVRFDADGGEAQGLAESDW